MEGQETSRYMRQEIGMAINRRLISVWEFVAFLHLFSQRHPCVCFLLRPFVGSGGAADVCDYFSKMGSSLDTRKEGGGGRASP